MSAQPITLPISSLGLPSDENVRYTNGYVAGFSTLLRTPRWVVEYIPPKDGPDAKEGSREGSKFHVEETIPEMFRATNADYTVGAVSGLSRGHLAAAQFHKDSQASMDDTFNLSLNIVPQSMAVNGCDWFRLEQMVKKLSKKYRGMWVATGPATLPKAQIGPKEWIVEYRLIGDRRVAVPTHTYKVLVGLTERGEYHAAAFLMPNSPIPVEHPMSHYQVPIAEVEMHTGLSFFPRILATVPQKASVPNMCEKNVCEGSYGSFSQSYRHLSRMQAATSKAELEALWEEGKQKGYKDAFLTKQYESTKAQLRS